VTPVFFITQVTGIGIAPGDNLSDSIAIFEAPDFLAESRGFLLGGHFGEGSQTRAHKALWQTEALSLSAVPGANFDETGRSHGEFAPNGYCTVTQLAQHARDQAATPEANL